MATIYLDYNATTPVDEWVFEAMAPYLQEAFGNPSSAHIFGQAGREAVAKARKQVAEVLRCSSDEIVFTSGGSESNNNALKGAAWANRGKGNHIITSVIEHPAVTNPCRYLETQGYHVTCLPVDRFGMVNPADVEAAITEETILITIMHANNETGTIQPIAEIGDIACRRGIIFHTDAAQSVGKVPVKVDELNVDLLTVAGHKLYAPKGVGALYIRKGTNIEPLIHGAGHENGRRAGTENVPYIVALGEACNLAGGTMELEAGRITRLRDLLHRLIVDKAGDVKLNGHPSLRLPNTLNIGFKGVNGAEILEEIPDIAASTGSACHSGCSELSGVLKAMQVDPEYGFGSVRFSIGRYTTEEDIIRAAELVADRVDRLRKPNS